jgi:DNA repair protein RecO (recombination protein O)
MLVKHKGILINKTRFSETSMIIHLLTEDRGRQSFLAKAIFSKKSSNKISCLELMNIMEITAWKSSKSDLLTIKELSISHHYQRIPEHFYKKTIALFIAEFLHRSITSPDADTVLFNFVEKSMKHFDMLTNNYTDFHHRFLSHFTKYLGIIPVNDFSSSKKYFNILSSSFSNIQGEDVYFFNKQSSLQLHEYLKTGITEDCNRKFSLADRNQFLDDILRFYSYHLSHFSGLKSLSVLKSVIHY